MGFSLTSLLATASLALAIPHDFQIGERAPVSTIDIRYRHDKVTNKYALAVLDKDTHQVLARVCDKSIRSGAFSALPIHVDADGEAFGTITVGSRTHAIGHRSRQVDCWSMYSNRAATVTCHVSLRHLPALDFDALAHDTPAPPCFDNFPLVEQSDVDGTPSNVTQLELAQHEIGNEGLETVQAQDQLPSHPTLRARQGSILRCPPYRETRLVGDGNPHQNYYHVQMTSKGRCGDGDCEISYETSETKTFSWTASASIAGWISGGFAVEKSHSFAENFNCVGKEGHDTNVCVWQMIAHTAYTVQNYIVYPCSNKAVRDGDPFILWSPNANNVGSEYYCVRNTCRAGKGDNWWDKSPSRPGGPRDW
ncbi:uncharacterized protein PODANS_7_445 [Podospora anserina S mat+]|uniref:Podospora anserina S mat+ genomic DNA chromosome 7, supercontig 3 n=1 Tax=Podospora anserina (strain S / ATCC MYA-4624 / DSM 980 / FGSC 10383) TaxID=515849 RepID=B2AP83_PODAN|nr:uncharacterized protein PODANS_7_445 [Podospora anserina S mat+]CAP65758.1 unnamed protein product [Podospora anserina S mat+]CDP32817.1 Putative protein of unknown function [Podospora anserina S mat+]